MEKGLSDLKFEDKNFMISDLLKQADIDCFDDDEEGGEDDPYLESYYPEEEEAQQQMISKIMSSGTGPSNLSGFASVQSDSKTIQQMMMDLRLHTGASDDTTFSSIPLNTLEMSGDVPKEPIKTSRSNNL